MLKSVSFDEKKFVGLMQNLLKEIFNGKLINNEKLLETIKDAFPRVSEKKFFVAEHASFFENFLVNELFLSVFPWKFEGSIAQNFSAFVAEYKLFELIIFSVALKGFTGEKNFIETAGWFTTRFDHSKEFKRQTFSVVKDDEIFLLMSSLLEGSD